MSRYLDDLIDALEAQADEQRAYLDKVEHAVKLPDDADGPLKRTLQRLEVLRELRTAERRRASSRAAMQRHSSFFNLN
jgi:hypothetical protein